MHIHVHHEQGEAKFWLELKISLARNYRLTPQQIRSIESIIEANHDAICASWRKHFS